MKKPKLSAFALKVQKGLQMAYDDLVRKTAAEDGELYFSENGKVVAVKAKKLLRKKKK